MLFAGISWQQFWFLLPFILLFFFFSLFAASIVKSKLKRNVSIAESRRIYLKDLHANEAKHPSPFSVSSNCLWLQVWQSFYIFFGMHLEIFFFFCIVLSSKCRSWDSSQISVRNWQKRHVCQLVTHHREGAQLRICILATILCGK